MPERLGKYELLERIGVGGMAEVYRSRSHGAAGTVRQCVVKRMLPFPDEDRAAMVDLFVSEARLSMQLTHGNVVQVFDFGEHEGHYFLVMELVDGISLADALDVRGALPPQLAALILIEVLRGLHYAHTRCDERDRPLHLVHRDVSPDNILLGRDGQVKLTDFGIARASMVGRTKTDPGIFRGKMAYSSPEQLRADELDARSDVYACALTLWKAVTGENPQTDIVLKLAMGAAQLPDPGLVMEARLAHVLRRATAFDPLDRTASAQELRVQLSAWLDEQGMPFRETAVAGLVQLVREGPAQVDRALVEWLDRAKPRQAVTAPETPAVSPARVTRLSKAQPKPPRRSPAGVVGLLGLLGLTVVGGVALLSPDDDPGAMSPLEVHALPPSPPPTPQRKSEPVPLPAPVSPALPELVRSAQGVPVRVALSTKDFGFDVTRVGLAVAKSGARVRLQSLQPLWYFAAPPIVGPLQLVGTSKQGTAIAQGGRVFLIAAPGRNVDGANPDLAISWSEGGKARTETRARILGEANVFVDEHRFHVQGLDPALKYQVTASGPAGAQVLVVGEAAPPAMWPMVGDPKLSGTGPTGERVLNTGGSMTVKSVRSLVLTLPTWPDQPEHEVVVTVQRDPASRIRIDRGNAEAQRMDQERRMLEREAPRGDPDDQ